QDSPGAVVVDRVPADYVVARTGKHHARADGGRVGAPRAGHVRVIVVVHRVFREQPAVVRPGRTGAAVRARPVLRRWGVVVVLAVAYEARLVVVELRVLDGEMPAAVLPSVPNRVVLGVVMIDDRVAVRAGDDAEGRRGHRSEE